MTNHWNDIDNSSLVFVMGANPAENHPACMAHINAARARGAKLVVVDPRKTRTALQADDFIRIRPGADIAFVNAMINYIFTQVDAGVSGYNHDALANMLAWHNGTAGASTAARSFVKPDNTAVNITISKYTDSLFRVAANGDYQRETDASGVANFPKRAATVEAETDTVWMKLKDHVAEYDLVTAADICGCSQADIILAAQYFIDHSRFASHDFGLATSKPEDKPSGGYRATSWLYAMGGTQHTYGSQNIREYAVIQSLMGNMGRAGGGIDALRGIHNVQGSTDMGLLYDTYPAYGTMAKDGQTWAEYMNLQFGKKTVGSGAVDAENYAVLGMQQRGFYAMTRQFFSGAANASKTAVVDEAVTLTGVAASSLTKGSIKPGTVVVKNAAGTVTYDEGTDYNVAYGPGKVQRVAAGAITDPEDVVISFTWTTALTGAQVAGMWGLWPKNNGYDHITSFRKMRSAVADADRVRACYILGQNPAISEPNQSAVRDGLNDLDLLVVQEMFATETVQCKRKDHSVTYLLPACSYVEEAGSVTNSGRWIQWREKAADPKSHSKADLELVLRLAKALDDHSAFGHIPLLGGFTNRFDMLYKYYAPDWTIGGAFDSETIAENAFKELAAPQAEGYSPTGADLTRYTINAGDPLLRGATWWIYFNAYCNNVAEIDLPVALNATDWGNVNRSKSRIGIAGTANTYSKWGWAWLKNRRVFYNNGEVPGDVADNFVAPDYLARLYIARNTAVVDYAGGSSGYAYRNYKVMKDVSSVDATHPNGKNGTNTYGQFPAFSEMIESNRPDLVTTWGNNDYIDTASYNAGIWDESASPTPAVFHKTYIEDGATKIGTFNTSVNGGPFPLLLTSIRCVEHFQGGPITRNNTWNIEAEPVPWIEINSTDALKYAIADGDWVNVKTARSDSKTGQQGRSNVADGWAKGFKARVGVGLQSNQRVAPGVVAIPWHWGEQGLSTGSRANDLCIDASDANTKIPEYKACLCKIEKM